jgi:hypothetical protein
MKINRYELVRRHNPVITEFEALSPLTVGNGEMGFTVDATGLQTFPQAYAEGMPLCTQSQWGWHCETPGEINPAALTPKCYNTYGRSVGYFTSAVGQEDTYHWLRRNPHRINLVRIGLILRKANGQRGERGDITGINQVLDLWQGEIVSSFRFEGDPVRVRTICHPREDVIAVALESDLMKGDRLGVIVEFPYSVTSNNICHKDPSDWEQPNAHRTEPAKVSPRALSWERFMGSTQYFMTAQFSIVMEVVQPGRHSFEFTPRSGNGERFDFVIRLTPNRSAETLPSFSEVEEAAQEYWRTFWTGSGVVELADSKDSRALELERRIILSQYLTAIQCSGTMPPQETGLTCNSWYGKFHLEMHWWHAAHFPLWGRVELLERSLGWYQTILAKARENAARQGYQGARWPKMVGPDGSDSPSPIAPLLIWQQPHPIYFAELCYRAHPDRQTLELYRELVMETAEFMASFTAYDQANDRFVLGPPLIPAQENHQPEITINPGFELEYWVFGLTIAGKWRKRLGLPENAGWNRIIAKLSRLPVKDGAYLSHEACPETYTRFNTDHPSMLCALGMLPGTTVDWKIMRKTLAKVIREWRMETAWGWDYPVMAMTAARLGQPALAIDCLLMDVTKNTYLKNGHNYQNQGLPLYLPGNGGLLVAVAMMTAGWDNGPAEDAPGFPKDGNWKVSWEGLSKLP